MNIEAKNLSKIYGDGENRVDVYKRQEQMRAME